MSKVVTSNVPSLLKDVIVLNSRKNLRKLQLLGPIFQPDWVRVRSYLGMCEAPNRFQIYLMWEREFLFVLSTSCLHLGTRYIWEDYRDLVPNLEHARTQPDKNTSLDKNIQTSLIFYFTTIQSKSQLLSVAHILSERNLMRPNLHQIQVLKNDFEKVLK